MRFAERHLRLVEQNTKSRGSIFFKHIGIMTELDTKVRVPFLWGKAVFKKSRWSQINLIVGPNGSGKTILAQELTKQFEAAGKSVKFISEERNSNLDILRDNEKIRTKTEKVLSEMFGKSITFIEDIDGTFIPIVKNKAWNVEYMMEDAECHGLQKIISLLINLILQQQIL